MKSIAYKSITLGIVVIALCGFLVMRESSSAASMLANLSRPRVLEAGKLLTTPQPALPIMSPTVQSTKQPTVALVPSTAMPTVPTTKPSKHKTTLKQSSTFNESVHQYAVNQSIIILIVDSGFIDIAVNFYKTSLEKLNLTNYIYVGIDKQVCLDLNQMNIHCVTHNEPMSDKGSRSNYGSNDFVMKTHFKTQMVLLGLQLGYNVLISDIDIVIFKNPFDFFNCSTCDIEISNDIYEGNSGFYFARPTPAAIEMHSIALKCGIESNGTMSNQKAIHKALSPMVKNDRLKVNQLAKEAFPNGKNYFEEGQRYFIEDSDCDECVMMHNNWIVSEEAKTYRFKEMGFWALDKDAYYSSPTRKYLSFDYPSFTPRSPYTMKRRERKALLSAFLIAHVLNRTVISPRFHSVKKCEKIGKNCDPNDRRPLNYYYKVAALNRRVGVENYRENCFLQSPLVPDNVKSSVSEPLVISSTQLQELQEFDEELEMSSRDLKVFTPSNYTTGPSVDELLSWFSDYKDLSILHFYSLYGVYSEDSGDALDKEYNKILQKGLVDSTFNQL